MMQKAGLCPRCSPRVTVPCRQARQEVQRSQHLCGAAINVDAATERKYMAMLTMVAKVQRLETSLRGNKRDSLLHQLAAKRSELTSTAFLHWVASQEAAAEPGEFKLALARLAERLVILREELDQQRMDTLHERCIELVGASQLDRLLPASSDTPSSPAMLTGGSSGSSSSGHGIVNSSSSSSTGGMGAGTAQHIDTHTVTGQSGPAQGYSPGSSPAQQPQVQAPNSMQQHQQQHGCVNASSPLPSACGGLHSPNSGQEGQPAAAGAAAAAGASTAGAAGAVAAAAAAATAAGAEQAAGMWPGGDTSPAQTSPVPTEAVAASLAVATAGSVSGVVAGSGSVSGQGPGTSLGEAGSPRVFGLQLAQALTGRAAVLTGYANPLYDAILSVAPPVSLSPQALADSHRQANELAKDLRARRRSSVASLLARIQVSPEQRDQLLAGSAASRILDLLLSMGSTAERVALLPDCFTPPDLPADSSPNTGSETGTQPDDEHDALWCTPAQLLTEVDSRLRRMEQAATALSDDKRLLPSNGEQLVDAQLRDALQQLRPAVHEMMLQGLTAAGARVRV
ncbi:hypothetical protein QJQ45_015456 [Haematococcus lacustris]|nr:hypothetical protein QJQ45_015456 [Haematococcus lacustris]